MLTTMHRAASWVLQHNRMPNESDNTKLDLRGTRRLCEHYGYTLAKYLFKHGRIPAVQAMGMIMQDRDFISEAELQGNFGDHAKRNVAELTVHNWKHQILKGDMS